MDTSTAQVDAPQDIDAIIRRNVKILTATTGIKPTTIYRQLGMSRQTYSSRLTDGGTRFTAVEVIVIAGILGVTVEQLAGATEALVAAQNWRENNRPDLHVLHGGGITTDRQALLSIVR